MQIEQYVYFGIISDELSPDQIAERVGLAPDSAAARGSRSIDPLRPPANLWRIECSERGLTISDQTARVLARVEPHRVHIRGLVESGEARAWLQLVRYLNSDAGEEEKIEEIDSLVKLPGQHQLLGWHLERDVLDFLHDVRADIDADEYG